MRIGHGLTRKALRVGLLATVPVATAALLFFGGADAPEADVRPTIQVSPPVPSLPIEVNDRVERWIERYQTVERVTFERYLERRGLYESMIRGKLRARGMPEELIYLAMIESGFAPDAVSPVAATGVWQFMANTARAEGLRVDTWVDERRDPVRATDAALEYLERLHERFGSWTFLFHISYLCFYQQDVNMLYIPCNKKETYIPKSSDILVETYRWKQTVH